jgi:hypothetical protein
MTNTPIMVTGVEDKTPVCDKCSEFWINNPRCLLILWLVCMIVMSVVISENYSNVDGSLSN